MKTITMSETKYELVDVDGLATCLAEDAWKEETKNLSTEDLYDTLVSGDKEQPLKKTVKAHWAYNFFALRDAFLRLIKEHVKQ